VLVVAATTVVLVWTFSAEKPEKVHGYVKLPEWVFIASIVVFLLPVSGGQMVRFLRYAVRQHREPVKLFSDENPVGISAETIAFLRTKTEPRKLWWVPCRGPETVMLGIYSPIYQIPLFGNILGDNAIINDCEANKDPLFSNSPVVTEEQAKGVMSFIAKEKPDYILGRRRHLGRFESLLERFPDRFSVAFSPASGNEMVLRVLH